jgi:hypothetical protein
VSLGQLAAGLFASLLFNFMYLSCFPRAVAGLLEAVAGQQRAAAKKSRTCYLLMRRFPKPKGHVAAFCTVKDAQKRQRRVAPPPCGPAAGRI